MEPQRHQTRHFAFSNFTGQGEASDLALRIPQRQQAEAALTAYTNDDGDFAEAVRSQIAEVNAKIDALAIAINRQKLIAEANYLLLSGV